MPSTLAAIALVAMMAALLAAVLVVRRAHSTCGEPLSQARHPICHEAKAWNTWLLG